MRQLRLARVFWTLTTAMVAGLYAVPADYAVGTAVNVASEIGVTAERCHDAGGCGTAPLHTTYAADARLGPLTGGESEVTYTIHLVKAYSINRVTWSFYDASITCTDFTTEVSLDNVTWAVVDTAVGNAAGIYTATFAAQAAQHVRIRATAYNNATYGMILRGAEVFAGGTVPIKRTISVANTLWNGSTVTSPTLATPENLCDMRPYTYGPNGSWTNGNAPAEATITLNDVYPLYKFSLMNFTDNRAARNFTVEISPDPSGATWTLVKSVTDAPLFSCPTPTYYDFDAPYDAGISARRVRVTFQSNWGGTPMYVQDMEFFALVPNQPPVALCQDITVMADNTCAASVAAAAVDNGSNDPEGPVTLTLSPAGPLAVGSHSVTLTATDSEAASGSCAATITVTPNDDDGDLIVDTICGGTDADDDSPPTTYAVPAGVNLAGELGVTVTQCHAGGCPESALHPCYSADTRPGVLQGGESAVTYTVHLVHDYNIDTVVWEFYGPTIACTDFTTETSVDGSTWSVADTAVGNAAQLYTATFTPRLARHVRIRATAYNNASFGMILRQVKVYGPDPLPVSRTISVASTEYNDSTVTGDPGLTTPQYICDNETYSGAGGRWVSANVVDLPLQAVITLNGAYDLFRMSIANFTDSRAVRDFRIEVSPVASGDYWTLVKTGTAQQTSCPTAEYLDFDAPYDQGARARRVRVTLLNTWGGSGQLYLQDLEFFALTANVPPVASCQDITVTAGTFCTAALTAAQIDAGSSDFDGPVTLTIDPSTPLPVGSHSVTLTATDSDGATDSCTATVTVLDRDPSYADGSAVNLATIRTVVATASANVGGGYTLREPLYPAFNREIRWNNNYGPAWYQVELPDVYQLSRVVVGYHSVITAVTYDVKVSLDGSTWTTVASTSGTTSIALPNDGQTDKFSVDNFTPVPARFVRLDYASEAGWSQLIINRLQLFGPNDPPITPDISVAQSGWAGAPTASYSDPWNTIAGTSPSRFTTIQPSATLNDDWYLLRQINPNTDGTGNYPPGDPLPQEPSRLYLTLADTYIVETVAWSSIGDSRGPKDMDIYLSPDETGNTWALVKSLRNLPNPQSTYAASYQEIDLDTPAAARRVRFDVLDVHNPNPWVIGTEEGYFGELYVYASLPDCNHPPVASCQDLSVAIQSNGSVTITAAALDNGSSDPDGDTLAFSASQTTFTCADLGDNPVTLTVADGNGGTATCEATVTVTAAECTGVTDAALNALCAGSFTSYDAMLAAIDAAIAGYLNGGGICDTTLAACRAQLLLDIGMGN